MNENNYVPGPYDTFRGVIEIDCSECLPPDPKAKLRIGKIFPLEEMHLHAKPLDDDESNEPKA
ncbi:MAG TPA: hypothetical protein VGL71_05745 [Urbifossiella sp.]|jgi:hypothetical protein